ASKSFSIIFLLPFRSKR
ncbi:putative membrane protein, partial [Vibrio harveyi]